MANRRANREGIERLLDNVSRRAVESQRKGDSSLAAHLFSIRGQRALDLGDLDTAIASYQAAATNARKAQRPEAAEYTSKATELKVQKMAADEAQRDAAIVREARRVRAANAREERQRMERERQQALEAERREFGQLKDRRFNLNTYISKDAMRAKLAAVSAVMMSGLDIYISSRLGGALEYVALAPSLTGTGFAGFITGFYSKDIIGMKRALSRLNATIDAREESLADVKESAQERRMRESKISRLENHRPLVMEAACGNRLRLKFACAATAAMAVLDAYIASKLGGVVEGIALVPSLALTALAGLVAAGYSWFMREGKIELAESKARLADLKRDTAQNSDADTPQVRLLRR